MRSDVLVRRPVRGRQAGWQACYIGFHYGPLTGKVREP
jgi:hypothetical protein